tara:strand:+ start:88 stop:996 length:909 start_codon:yes stop_codon:yes gene_type:complete
MANNKLHGYNPDPSKEVDGNRLDKFNPYEFRKGMDYELIAVGCSQLSESTDDERRKATETVLSNLKEHGGYYTALITYETQFRNLAEGSKKPAFKQWLAEQGESSMKEVGKKGVEFKNDKMTELKEAIKTEIKNILEVKGKEAEKINKADDKKEKDDDKTSVTTAKGKAKKLAALEKESSKLDVERTKLKDSQKAPLAKYKDGKMSSSEYTVATKDSVKRIKEIIVRLKEIEGEKEAITLSEKLGRREVAKTMMEKDTHMEILNIIKEAGVNLREGADGIKMYYEIAKTAYQEGFMAGVNKN